MGDQKSKVLIIGGTGYIGKWVVEASVKAGHSIFVLVRESTVNEPAKFQLVQKFKDLGVTLLHGDMYEHEGLVKAIKHVDVEISAVGFMQLADQVKIIAAIKEAGNVKRFFPSEFGTDPERCSAVEPAKSVYVEQAGLPYTYVASNCFAAYFLPRLVQPGLTAPPRDKVTILGDRIPKEDIGTYTIKAVGDPRTLNKVLYIRTPKNSCSFNDLVAIWKKKIGKTLEKVYVSGEQILKDIQESPRQISVMLAISHSMFVNGDHTNFEIEPSFGVEASELYPDVKYTTVDEYLDQFV